MRYAICVSSALLLLAAAAPAGARPGHSLDQPPHVDGGRVVLQLASHGSRRATFSNTDRSLVRVYFAQNQVVWTGLPPGIAKNIARGKKLPHGIAKHALPAGLRARLPKRAGYEYARVGQDVVLIEQTSGVVADMIERIFS
jgi:hypothetical protein